MYKFFISNGANALALGVQQVFIAWLAVGVFKLSSVELGWVQFAVLGPRLLFLFLFTRLGDSYNTARIYKLGNIAVALSHMLALAFYSADAVNNDFLFLLFYGISVGSFGSFIQVSKEKLLRELKGMPISKAISLAGFVNHTAQGLGIVLASLMDFISVESIFAILALAAMSSFILFSQLNQELAETQRREHFEDTASIWSGFLIIWNDQVMRQVILLTAFNGFMHMGMFIVLMPMIARDIMGFSALEYGLLQLSFMVGATTAHFWILHRKIERPGHNLIFNVLYAALVAFAIAKHPTIYGLYGLVFLWGCIAGASSNVGRLIVQNYTQDHQVGRAMSVYQLALFGCAPIGAVVCGHMVQVYGVWQTLQVIAYASFAAFFMNFLSRKLWDVKA